MLQKKRVLIAAWPDDIHALAVEHVLNDADIAVDYFRSSDYPIAGTISDYLGCPEDNQIVIESDGVVIRDEEYFAVWWRRYVPFRSITNLHPDDKPFVDMENREYSRHFPHIFARTARWVNSPSGGLEGNNKQLQLREACAVGLAIPQTLVTNNRDHAKKFIEDAHNKGRAVIFKTAFPHDWDVEIVDGKIRTASNYTKEIGCEDLADAAIFQAFAGIFQYRQNSLYEVRAVFMGSSHVAIEYNLKTSPNYNLDSKRNPLSANSAKRHILPENIAEKCFSVMGKMGLNFASIDLLVLQDGTYVFLEINPEGQWLWLEHVCSEIKLLSPFCDFLINGFVDEKNFRRNHNDVTLETIQSHLKPERHCR